nr:homeobox protein HB1-like [Lytechinus pictus]
MSSSSYFVNPAFFPTYPHAGEQFYATPPGSYELSSCAFSKNPKTSSYSSSSSPPSLAASTKPSCTQQLGATTFYGGGTLSNFSTAAGYGDHSTTSAGYGSISQPISPTSAWDSRMAATYNSTSWGSTAAELSDGSYRGRVNALAAGTGCLVSAAAVEPNNNHCSQVMSPCKSTSGYPWMPVAGEEHCLFDLIFFECKFCHVVPHHRRCYSRLG